MLTVHVDFDDTLIDMITPWFEAYNNATGDNITFNDAIRWDVSTIAREGSIVYNYLTPEIYEYPSPLPMALTVTRRMAKYYHLVCITSCKNTQKSELMFTAKARVLNQFFPWFEDIVRWDGIKSECAEVNFLIDDCHLHFQDQGIRGMMLNKPYNINESIVRPVARVRSWYDIGEQLGMI